MPELDNLLDGGEENVNKVEQRIKDLSSKVALTSKERDELAEAKTNLEAERDAISRERDFYQNFSDVVAQYPNAKDHKDDIMAKVKAGYSVEDATISTLAKAGKLEMTKPREEANIAGGSAVTNPPNKANKEISEMTQDEKRSALMESLGIN